MEPVGSEALYGNGNSPINNTYPGGFPVDSQTKQQQTWQYHVGNSYTLFFLFAYLLKSVLGPFQDDIKV